MQYKYAHINVRPRTTDRGPRTSYPEKWLSGPTMFDRDRFYAWHKHRSQANFRKEDYALTFIQWCEFWPNEELWEQRGRERTALVLVRIDPELAWCPDNCEIITRYEQLLRSTARKQGKKYAQNNQVSETF